MKNCLICHTRVRFIKFKSQDGYVCKSCYEDVSLNFTQTITDKTKPELLNDYQNAQLKKELPDFNITRRVNQFILFDDTRQIFCLPNHPAYSSNGLGPEYYLQSEVANCRLEETHEKKETELLGTLRVIIEFNERRPKRQIRLISKAISCDSMPYKTMKTLAEKIVKELN